MAKCFSCGKKADPVEDRCYGCHRIVCVPCVKKYGHMMNGEHGRRPIHARTLTAGMRRQNNKVQRTAARSAEAVKRGEMEAIIKREYEA